MNNTLPSEYSHNTAQMSAPQLSRRTSRSSGSQTGYHSARVEKPRSNHHSPMMAERRKTTSGTKRYATLDDHYRMMFGMGEEEESQQQTTRPVSWHPSSAQFQVTNRSSYMSGQPSPQEWSNASQNPNRRSDFYSLSTCSPIYHEERQYFSPYHHESNRGSQSTDGSWQEVPQQTPTYALSSFPTPTEQMPWYLQEWARKNQAQSTISQHGSTDFLPIQHPSHEETLSPMEDEDMEVSGKELVGMGLYDLPDTSATWTSGLVESTGKGLKLEEGWQPPEENEDEDEDEEADDESSDDGSVEEIPVAKPTVVQQQLPLSEAATKPHVPGNMDGQSFFFDEDETYTKEWWYHQLKQPTLPVRDAGLGYGWL